jgi:hypothetical protein
LQIAENRISKIDPKKGRALATMLGAGAGGTSGIGGAEGRLWVGNY